MSMIGKKYTCKIFVNCNVWFRWEGMLLLLVWRVYSTSSVLSRLREEQRKEILLSYRPVNLFTSSEGPRTKELLATECFPSLLCMCGFHSGYFLVFGERRKKKYKRPIVKGTANLYTGRVIPF